MGHVIVPLWGGYGVDVLPMARVREFAWRGLDPWERMTKALP